MTGPGRSALIPHGEKLVIDAVRARRDEIRDPALRARVSALIGQEAMHSKVHQAFYGGGPRDRRAFTEAMRELQRLWRSK